MKRFALLMTLGLAAALVTQTRSGWAQEPVLIDRIIAKVNGDIITLSAFEASKAEVVKELHERKVPQEQISAEMPKLEVSIMQTLIDEKLIAQKAQELGIEVESDLNKEWTRLAASLNVPVEQFDHVLEQNHMDPERGRESIRSRLRREALLNGEVYRHIYLNISEQQARDFYDEHKAELATPATVTLREIFIPFASHTPSESDTLAREVLNQVRSGADFATLVPKYTDPSRPSRANGGALGTIELRDLGEIQANAIKGLKTGDTAEPIRLPDGYQILHIDEFKPEQAKPFEDVRREVLSAMTFERGKDKVEEYLKKLRARAYIELTKGYEHLYNANIN